ncbi:hypothetical protein EDB84DRAFT_1511916 [Lactarius hengduanensis]|nr:hypothetical protein EDB84DRAFT_1511916 [Lactarius hengduanensis]
MSACLCADSDSKNWVTISFNLIFLSSVALAVLDCRDMTALGSEIVGTAFWLCSSFRLAFMLSSNAPAV